MSEHSARVSQPRDHKLIVEKDVAIPLRDGTMIYADVYRPDCGAERVPALVNLSVYQKDKVWIPPPDLEEKANPYMNWETGNPLWWCPRGYALVRIDARGSGKSPGRSEPNSYQESLDYYDAIEWIAKRPWCSGSIGTHGISYHAMAQWRLANLQPPSLKAMLPWEGRSDMYRESYHGGIFVIGFIGNWYLNQCANHLLGRPRSYNPDAFNNNMIWEFMAHDLDSEYWRARSAQWDRITVPVYSVGNWTSFSLHLRGNTEAFVNAASRHKKLRIHSGTHFHAFYSEEGRMDQLRWFDHWLKGIDTGIMDEPSVKLEIRSGGSKERYGFRFENEWPLARTQWTKWYLKIEREQSADAMGVEGRLANSAPGESARISYAASIAGQGHGGGRNGVAFETPPMEADTEITGPLVLNLWVSSSSEDADIMASLRHIGPDGKDIFEVGPQGAPAVLTRGWLRASHRKLDLQRSLAYRPYHAHDERRWLKPDEPVECQVEIWPTSIVLKKGHRLRLDIQPRDGIHAAPYTHYHADYNLGAVNSIYAGGDRVSYLLVPIVPPRAG